MVPATLLGIVGTIAFLLTWVLAMVVYATRPDRSQNRRLAFLLVILGSFTFFLRPLRMFLPGQEAGVAAWITGIALVPLIPFAYASFLATLNTPLSRPLRPVAVRAGLAIAGVAFSAIVVLRPHIFIDHVEPFPYVPTWSVAPTTELINLNYIAIVAPSLYAFFVALSAVRFAVTKTARRQAVAYAWAFGIHDLVFALEIGTLTFFLEWYDTTRLGNILEFLVPAIRAAVLPVLLSYGILRTQLFDIDLKLKWTISRGTIAASFVGCFLLASKLSESWAAKTFGQSWVLGAVAAALLLFALTPLQRMADRVANAALPHVQATQQYTQFRKMEVYKGALEDAARDGVVTPKERDVLEGLRRRLGIDPHAAAAMERDVLASRRG